MKSAGLTFGYFYDIDIEYRKVTQVVTLQLLWRRILFDGIQRRQDVGELREISWFVTVKW